VVLGIGDDAAVLRVGRDPLVWTVDVSVQGVHFDLRWLSLADVGYRATQAAVSDLAAMGATAVGALSSLVLPAEGLDVLALARGQACASRALGCPIIGGNVSSGPVLEVTTTVLGQVAHPLTRQGARPGQELWLLGEIGLARAGLLWLMRGRGIPAPAAEARALRRCLRAWRRPRALLEEGRSLLGRASAAMDVSDGLQGDCRSMAEASGVRLVLDEGGLEACLAPELRRCAALLGTPALRLALEGGEDYALLATGPKRRRPPGARVIGQVVAGRGVGLRNGRDETELTASGFDHLAAHRA